MTVDSLTAALRSLQSDRPEAIAEGLEHLRANMGTLPEAEFRGVVEELCALFYVDTADRPDLQPFLDLAVGVLAAQGPRIVPQLLELMKGSDIKSHLPGRSSHQAPALRPAASSYRGLAAHSPLRGRKIRRQYAALPEIIGSLMHPDKR
jgi:hypothetical protein